MRMFSLKHILGSGFIVSTVCFSVPAMSEPYQVPVYERNQELSVFLRSDPTLTPTGIIAGNYKFYPSLTTDLVYSDNVFSDATNERDDFILRLNPNLRIRSNFDRHQLDFFLNAKQQFNQEYTTENRLEYDFGTYAKYDLNSSAFIPLRLNYEQKVSSRGDPDDSNAIESTEYDIFSAESGFRYSGQLIDFDALIKLQDLTYDDVQTTTGLRNNQDRNRTETSGYLRLGLSSSTSNFAPYIYTNYRDISYDDSIDDSGFNRSADEIGGGIGARFRLSSLTSSSLQIGYVSFDPEDATFDTVNDITYNANITWEPSTLMAVSLTGTRSVEVTTLNNLTASVDSTIDLGLIYELSSSIFLRPLVSYEQKDYEGVASAELERMNYSLGVDYKMNKNVWWNAEYQFTQQEDPENSPLIGEYDRSTFLLSMRLQF